MTENWILPQHPRWQYSNKNKKYLWLGVRSFNHFKLWKIERKNEHEIYSQNESIKKKLFALKLYKE